MFKDPSFSPQLPEIFREEPAPDLPSVEDTHTRFGNENEIVSLLENGHAEIISSVDNYISSVTNGKITISEHANVVEVVKLLRALPEGLGVEDEDIDHANTIHPVIINENGHEPLLCIFKPLDGESEETKMKLPNKEVNFYENEHRAYLTSHVLGFHIVPPTVIRVINGKIGSLQLFMDHKRFATAKNIISELEDSEYERVVQSQGFKKLALFDWITACPERHEENWMIEAEYDEELGNYSLPEAEEPNDIGIDHGVLYSTENYLIHTLRGPILHLTFDNVTNSPRKVPIDEELMNLLRESQDNWEDLSFALAGTSSPPRDTSLARARLDMLVKCGHYLSKRNIHLFPELDEMQESEQETLDNLSNPNGSNGSLHPNVKIYNRLYA